MPISASPVELAITDDQVGANAKTSSDDVVQSPTAAVTIINYDFNSTTPCTAAPISTATNVSSTFSITGTCSSAAGTATTATAFTTNSTAGNAPSTTGATSNVAQFTLGGSALATYSNYKLYFQLRSSGTGPMSGLLEYSTNGGTSYTSGGTYTSGNAVFTATNIDLTSATTLNGATNIIFRLTTSGGTANTGTFRIDNFQVQADNGAAATPTVSLSASSNTASEATVGTIVTVTATLSSAVATDQTVTLAASGAATLNSDYTLAGANLNGTTLTIPANSTTSSVTFTVIDDALVEGTENAILTISNPSSGISLGTPVSQTIAIADNDAANPTVNLSIAPATGSETAQTTFTATATASSAPTTAQTVNFALTSGTATAADFTTIAGTITIPANATTGTTTFSVVDDTLVEGTENATFTISNPSAGILLGTTTTASVSITDNDTATDLTITQNAPATVASGGTLVYTVTFSNTPVAAVTTPFAVSFVLPTSGFSNPIVTSTSGCSANNTVSGGTVTFTGCTLPASGTQTVTISGTVTATAGTITSGTATVDTGNAVNETNETNNTATGVSTTVNAAPTGIVINEIYGGGGNAGATYNADYIELYNNGAATVDLSGYSLQYGSAPNGNFSGVIALPSTSIAPGAFYLIQTTTAVGTATGLTPNYTAPTGVNLSATNGNVILVAGTTTIVTCPAAGAANVLDRVGYGTGTCFEGTSAATAPSNTTSAQRVPNGVDTNNNAADFVAQAGTPGGVNTSPNVAPTITANPTSQTINSGGTGTSTITITDETPATVVLSGTSNNTTLVPNANIVFTGTGASRTLTVTPVAGQSGTATITITATDAGNLTGTATYVLTVIAQPGTIAFSAADYAVTEGTNLVTVTVNRTGGTDGAVSATYATSDGSAINGACNSAGADYQPATGTLNFAASASSATFTVSICDDAIYENTELFNLTLSAPTGGATLGAQSTATVTVADNDPIPTFSISDVSANEGDNGATTFTFTVSKSGASAVTATVDYATADNTAIAGEDYTAAAGTLTFAAGVGSQPVTVTVNGDTTNEPNETFFVNLTNSTNATISDAQAVGTILNDEVSLTTLDAPNCTGIAPTPLNAGSTNNALLCIALSSNSNANFTALNVPFTNDPSARFSNPRLISSVDSSYTTTGDNTTVAVGTVDTTQFTFVNFNAYAKKGKGELPSLTATPLNFFIVADVLGTVNTMTPGTQPSVAPANVTVSNGTVTGTTATGQNYTFTLAPTAASAEISGRVTNRQGRGLLNVRVTLSGGSLPEPVTVNTNTVGRYVLRDVPVGETYVITVWAKSHTFSEPSAVYTVNSNLSDVNFVSGDR